MNDSCSPRFSVSASASWFGRGGEGDDASLVTTVAIPSHVIDRRTHEGVFLTRGTVLSLKSGYEVDERSAVP